MRVGYVSSAANNRPVCKHCLLHCNDKQHANCVTDAGRHYVRNAELRGQREGMARHGWVRSSSLLLAQNLFRVD